MASIPTILIADRETNDISDSAQQLTQHFECVYEHVACETDLHIALRERPAELLIIDLDFSDTDDRFNFLNSLVKDHPQTVILPLIPTGDPQLIRRIFELDLFYFIHKPLDPLEASIALKRAYESTHPATAVINRKEPSATTSFHGMIGSSAIMQQLFDLITRIAEDDVSTVLIRGDSGTGKEMVAKAIHAQSGRRDKNFVPVNCAAIPDELLESELFGYTKGAFTGATTNKPGRIQYADQGTLFLDEIGDMKGSLQAKLLRVLQEKEFEPVGAFKPIPVNTRILAATHCDLEQLVKEGKFREDLYYRLSVVPVRLPSLRERTDDIPHLINAFLLKHADQRGRPRCSFSPKTLRLLQHYGWRGNVRELENLVQHMSILFSGKEIKAEDLPEKFSEVELPDNDDDSESTTSLSSPPVQNEAITRVSWQDGQVDFNELINDFETQLIIQALQMTEGNKKEAARLLNLKRTTLLEKIKKKEIDGLWEKGRR